MSNCIEKWCEPSKINSSYIDEQICKLFDQGHEPTHIYVSGDLYVKILEQFNMLRYVDRTVSFNDAVIKDLSFHSLNGTLNIKLVSGLSNFLHVGTESTFQNSWRIKVDKEFEEIFLGEK